MRPPPRVRGPAKQALDSDNDHDGPAPMNVSEVRAHCLGKPGAAESRPFGPGALVIKVAGRIFAIIADDAKPPSVSLKSDPEIADVLRQAYDAVIPGYHLNKQHWNTVLLDGSIPDDELAGWLDDSYDLVVDGLPGAVRAALQDGGTGTSRP